MWSILETREIEEGRKESYATIRAVLVSCSVGDTRPAPGLRRGTLEIGLYHHGKISVRVAACKFPTTSFKS